MGFFSWGIPPSNMPKKLIELEILLWKGAKMKSVVIRRPKAEDTAELIAFFKTVVTDTYRNEGIEDMVDDREAEIQLKKAYLNQDIESDGKERYFLIACDGDKIIGTIEYGPSSELIHSCTEHAYKELPELGTVFVHPAYQGQGVGNHLLIEMFATLKNKGIEEVCLDSGYTRAQKIWQHKFGEPAYLLQDYWGEGVPHMIWLINVSDFVSEK